MCRQRPPSPLFPLHSGAKCNVDKGDNSPCGLDSFFGCNKWCWQCPSGTWSNDPAKKQGPCIPCPDALPHSRPGSTNQNDCHAWSPDDDFKCGRNTFLEYPKGVQVCTSCSVASNGFAPCSEPGSVGSSACRSCDQADLALISAAVEPFAGKGNTRDASHATAASVSAACAALIALAAAAAAARG